VNKMAAATRCTQRIGTTRVTRSPDSTAGTLAIIMPIVVPAVTETKAS